MGTTYVNLIPASELSPGQAAKIKNDAINYLVDLVAKELSLPPGNLVVRDIRPASDLDYSYEDWYEKTGATVHTWEAMSSGTMGDQRWAVIFGIKDDIECLSCPSVKFKIGGGERSIIHLQALNEKDDMVGFFQGLLVIPQNVPYTISRYVGIINSASHIVLKGVIVEPRGKVISP